MLFEKRDPLLIPLLESYRDGHLRRLEKARRKGVTPKALTEIIGRMNVYINIAQEMHKMKLNDFINVMDGIAPRELATDWDNPGLLIGTEKQDIKRCWWPSTAPWLQPKRP